jgi:hypothetical protein
MAGYITPSELKAYPLPVTAAQWGKVGDDQLAIVIGYASEHLNDWMDRRLAVGNYVDRLDGKYKYRMILNNYPVIAVNYVTAYDANNSTPYDMEDFWIEHEAGIIEWIDRNRYTFDSRKWMVDYTAGYAQIPGPVKHAAALQTVKMLQPLFRGGTNFTETELIADLDDQIVELLDAYKRRRIG